MGRDNRFDIPEVFRRAMEEAGWDDGSGGDGGDGRPPTPRRPQQTPQINRSTWILFIIIALFLSLNWITTTYTDWLWFDHLGYRSVWLTQWLTKIGSFLVFFVIAAVIVLLNWHLARRRALKWSNPQQFQILQLPAIRWIITAIGLLLAFGFGSTGGTQWEEFLLYFNRVTFGAVDPIFQQDISFYFFELPIYQFLRGWLMSLLVVTILGVVPIYLVTQITEIQQGRWRLQVAPHMRRHAAVLLTIALLLWAVGHGFDLFNLLYSPRGVVTGASYTDMNASRWALWAQMITMGLAALAMAYNILRLDLRPLLITGGLWLAVTIALGAVYPGFLQRFTVEPNEIELERPYIQHNIDATRLAFNLNNIETRTFEIGDALTQEQLMSNDAILNNVRLWDYRPLQDSYDQLQTLRTYYQFTEIDIDRYEVNGQIRQVMLAARELNKNDLPSRSWVNEHLEFTHGYGVVMNPVDQVTSNGRPVFFIQDLPPQSNIDLTVTRPEIYYGEISNDVVFVGSGYEEFSYPSGSENVYSSYEGIGGVPLDTAIKRIAFAIREGDANILLSDEITPGTRIQFIRQISQRVKTITPFIELDSDPYLVVTDNGRLVWMIDGYTTSNRFPFATSINPATLNILDTRLPINYIRNAVKITVDAYDGNVIYYIADPDDPIIRSYERAFPNLFHSLDEMPDDLQSHLRYPEDLFIIQRQQYLKYHMLDVRVFYNQEDLWEVATEVFATTSTTGITDDNKEQIMEPYYVLLPLPGEAEPEYLLIQPYTPSGKDNMVAWLAARSDPPNYGELVVYELPKQELVLGPIQIESLIDQDTEISQQLTLWDQRGSSVIRGNLIVMPIHNNFLYVEPIYLRSESSALPELKRVIVSSNERIVMRETLAEALAALFEGEGETAVSTIIEDIEIDETTETTPETTTSNEDLSFDELVQSANAHFEAAQTAQRNGDWATYGTELEALGQDLQRLEELSQ